MSRLTKSARFQVVVAWLPPRPAAREKGKTTDDISGRPTPEIETGAPADDNGPLPSLGTASAPVESWLLLCAEVSGPDVNGTAPREIRARLIGKPDAIPDCPVGKAATVDAAAEFLSPVKSEALRRATRIRGLTLDPPCVPCLAVRDAACKAACIRSPTALLVRAELATLGPA